MTHSEDNDFKTGYEKALDDVLLAIKEAWKMQDGKSRYSNILKKIEELR